VFERFTEPARQVVVLAQDEARYALKHSYIGTEHLLLGLLRYEDGLAAQVLHSLDITIERVRSHVALIVGSGGLISGGQMPFTPRAKHALELAFIEAQRLGHSHVDTEHILLGLEREDRGVAARVLLDFGADAEKIRYHVIRLLATASARRADGPGDAPAKGAPVAPRSSGGATRSADMMALSQEELDRAIDRAVDQLILEEQDFSSRRQVLHTNLETLRAERDRRRRGDSRVHVEP
jgi:ATP-dependent Clp protease ATP-binding subunit ClpC